MQGASDVAFSKAQRTSAAVGRLVAWRKSASPIRPRPPYRPGAPRTIRARPIFLFKPRARIHTLALTAGDPVIMLEEPIPATRKALERAGMKIGDIDLFEVNEAFASVPLAWLKGTGADPAKLNVNGGAIALGHPLGATGAKLMATLVNALHARGKRWGLQTMCEGGGIANATIVEAL